MKTVFVFDDDDDILFTLKAWLEYENYIVNEFSTAQELCTALSCITPGIVILDNINNSNQLAAELCHKMTASCLYTGNIILTTTGSIQDINKEAIGAAAIVQKPFDFDDFLPLIQTLSN